MNNLIITISMLFLTNVHAEVYLFSGANDIESDQLSFYQDLSVGKKAFSSRESQFFLPSFYKQSLKQLMNFSFEGNSFQNTNFLTHLSGVESSVENLRIAVSKKKLKDSVVFYFTDHGNYDPISKKFSISSAKGELYTSDLEQLEKSIHNRFKESNVLFIQDHCFGAGHLSLIYSDADKVNVKDGVCGMSSSSPDELSYSGESMMHFFGSMLGRNPFQRAVADKNDDKIISYQEAFDRYKEWFIIQDKTGLSTPMSSMDFYLNNLYQQMEKGEKIHCNVSDIMTTYCEAEKGAAEGLSANFSILYLDQHIEKAKKILSLSTKKLFMNKDAVNIESLNHLDLKLEKQQAMLVDDELEMEESLMQLQNDLFEIIGSTIKSEEGLDDSINKAIDLIQDVPMSKSVFMSRVHDIYGKKEVSKKLEDRLLAFHKKYLGIEDKMKSISEKMSLIEVRRATLKSAKRDYRNLVALNSLRDKLSSDDPNKRDYANAAIKAITKIDDCESQEFFKR